MKWKRVCFNYGVICVNEFIDDVIGIIADRLCSSKGDVLGALLEFLFENSEYVDDPDLLNLSPSQIVDPLLFFVKYKLGLAEPGVDFVEPGNEDCADE